MAAATSVLANRKGPTQFPGCYSDIWQVSAVLDSASVATGAAGAGTDTITVPGVALGDHVISMSVGVSEAGVVRRAYVSAADTVTIATNNLTGGPVDLASTTIKVIVGRPAF